MAGSTNVDISCLTLNMTKMTRIKMTKMIRINMTKMTRIKITKMTRMKVIKITMLTCSCKDDNDGEFVGPVLVRVLLHHPPRQPRRLQV